MKQSNITTYQVPQNLNNARIDTALATLDPSRTRSVWQKEINAGRVMVDDKLAKKNHRVFEHDCIRIMPQPQPIPAPAPPDVNTIFVCDDYIIIDKPSGTVVHPDSIHPQGTTLIDSVIKTFPDIQTIDPQSNRPGIVHRLDRDVSGVMVIARTRTMFDSLKQQFQYHSIKKEYLALAYGILSQPEGEITFSIARSKTTGKMSARPQGDPHARIAKTHYSVIQQFPPKYSLLAIHILTGRTHQIRIHLHALGHSIVGDTLYRQKKFTPPANLNRIFLHSHVLGFNDSKNTYQEYNSPPPPHLEQFLNTL
ncbi:MAG: hypothetical protein A3H59_03810 [Candidatus Jacksonbacteria bacterium RIFCSPLOWO2_02_FULL_43_9]|nr:MAG: hypothetical protein A3H59_03810 [Candidatus Jacksonbacteria bacterium RIFCSPLOWO2_02_FULL_43_9]